MEEKKLTERLTEYGKKYPTKELNILRELEDMLDDGELLSKDYHDEQVFHYVDENAELREEIKTLKAELKKEIAEHEEFTKKAKAEIERLTKENEYLDMVAKQALADYQNAQVQVDELTDKLGKVLSGIKADELLVAKGVEQAVKDTAKEIYDFAKSSLRWDEEMFVDSLKHLIKERYGVEVE